MNIHVCDITVKWMQIDLLKVVMYWNSRISNFLEGTIQSVIFYFARSDNGKRNTGICIQSFCNIFRLL